MVHFQHPHWYTHFISGTFTPSCLRTELCFPKMICRCSQLPQHMGCTGILSTSVPQQSRWLTVLTTAGLRLLPFGILNMQRNFNMHLIPALDAGHQWCSLYITDVMA